MTYWPDALAAATERKARGEEPFTTEDKRRAWSWGTCAVCECEGIEFYEDDDGYCPVDTVLADLGYEFGEKVSDGDVGGAILAYRMIQERATFLRRPQPKIGEETA